MKAIKSLLIVCFVSTILLLSCGGGSKPEVVAEKFFTAVIKQDFDGAKKYCTKSSADMLDMMKSMLAVASDEEKKKAKEETKGLKVEILESDIDDEEGTAEVRLKAINGEGKELETTTVDLIKDGGNWKVDVKK